MPTRMPSASRRSSWLLVGSGYGFLSLVAGHKLNVCNLCSQSLTAAGRAGISNRRDFAADAERRGREDTQATRDRIGAILSSG